MKRNPNSTLVLAGLLCLALSPGCKKKEEAPATPPPKPAAHQAVPARPPAPVQKPVSSAQRPQQAAGLDFKTRKDPFKPLISPEPPKTEKTDKEKAEKAPVGKPSGEVLPIQSYDTSKFKVAGIVAGLKQNRALILDPAGKGYVVQEGMQIGSNDGRITRITSSTVEVLERFRDDSGHLRRRKVVLTLSKKK